MTHLKHVGPRGVRGPHMVRERQLLHEIIFEMVENQWAPLFHCALNIWPNLDSYNEKKKCQAFISKIIYFYSRYNPLFINSQFSLGLNTLLVPNVYTGCTFGS